MKIAVCYTKKTLAGERYCYEFSKGLKHSGEKVVIVANKDDVNKIDKCDLAFAVCGFVSPFKHHKSHELNFRALIARKLRDQNKRLLLIDNGYFEHMHKDIHAISYDAHKYYGSHYNTNSPEDRFKKFNIQIEPWRRSGKDILILGQTVEGASGYRTDILRYYEETLRILRIHTNRHIKFRLHPNEKLVNVKQTIEICKKFNVEVLINHHTSTTKSKEESYDKRNFLNDLQEVWATITFNSNAGILALLYGVPVFGASSSFVGAELSQNLIDIENPAYPDRLQWLYNISYSQWTWDEFSSGECWQHYKPYALERPNYLY